MGRVPIYEEPHRPRNRDSGCLRFFRALLMGMNILLTAGAVAGLAIGLLERSTMEATLKELCSSCHAMFIAYVVVFSLLLGFSLLGFFALCTRNVCLRVVYFVYLFLLFLGAFGISIAYVLVSTNRVNMEASWNKATVSNPDEMCSLELQFHCSGWSVLCNTPQAKDTLLLTRRDDRPLIAGEEQRVSMNHVRSTAEVFCPACNENDQKQINKYNTTCESVVLGTIREHMKEVLPVGLSVTGLALIGMAVTCLLQCETNRDEYYGVRYYRM
ncbi:hypothetical protein TRSC58_02533 [Trypanosoma rangeli SC58]|uniref:Tetraspanin n=1 Tax=Trypanosoma rangeli SC58 TaxID=429131 RepID=A0A061J2S6_TRYRA|nr:hypothetical protein TRSC58_02533 [Trypanosoma rangeli SC58]